MYFVVNYRDENKPKRDLHWSEGQSTAIPIFARVVFVEAAWSFVDQVAAERIWNRARNAVHHYNSKEMALKIGHGAPVKLSIRPRDKAMPELLAGKNMQHMIGKLEAAASEASVAPTSSRRPNLVWDIETLRKHHEWRIM